MSASRRPSAIPNTTRRMISSVIALVRSCAENGFPTGQPSASATASSSIMPAYPRRAAPLNAGMSRFLASRCSSSSRTNTECSPHTEARTRFASPARNVDAGLLKTSWMSSGLLTMT
jgi:hypothetical protein